MTLSSAASCSSVLLAELVTAALRGMALAACAVLLLRSFRPKAASVPLFVWNAVLYAALAMPILAWLLSPVRIDISLLSSAARAVLSRTHGAPAPGRLLSPAQAVHRKSIDQGASLTGGPRMAMAHGSLTQSVWASWTSSFMSVPWSIVAVIGYLAMSVFLVLRLMVGMKFSHRLARSSIPASPGCCTS